MRKGLIRARRSFDLTTAWAQRIVDMRTPGCVVRKVEVLSADVGTTTRVRLYVDHDARGFLPSLWFVKLPSELWRASIITALPRLLETEARFYKEVSGLVPARHPVVLAASAGFFKGPIVVLSDVTEDGGIVGSAADELTEIQAEMVIEQLALLHAAFWNSELLDNQFRWLCGRVRTIEDSLGFLLAEPLMRLGLKRAGDSVPAALRPLAMRYARRRRRVMRFLSDGPRSLVHHDLHPGNLYWSDGMPGFLDWQLVRVGEGVGDVAYFLATSLAPEKRRAVEASLLERYRLSLEANGVKAYDQETLIKRYRAHLVYAFEAMVVTLAIGGMMDRQSNLELISRAAAAVEDNGSFEEGYLGELLR